MRSDNGKVLENFAKKETPRPFKPGEGGEFMLELKRGGRARVQTEVLEFIALPFPSSKKLKIWSFQVVIVQGRQRNVQKGVMHVQSCCFAN